MFGLDPVAVYILFVTWLVGAVIAFTLFRRDLLEENETVDVFEYALVIISAVFWFLLVAFGLLLTLSFGIYSVVDAMRDVVVKSRRKA